MPDPVKMLRAEENDIAALNVMTQNLRRFLQSLPSSKERANSLTKLREMQMWADAAIRG